MHADSTYKFILYQTSQLEMVLALLMKHGYVNEIHYAGQIYSGHGNHGLMVKVESYGSKQLN